ncbi:ATP-grasp domain-containing protein [Nocardiopsis exhalans]|uniref:ATP-grasp domain-containing protein n=1 Tax=Nocardiopsis exhalans TaxID=163604 RepID=A0ABY5D8H2_9ACTN|nr:ATP-grasp domain-containing protein [Nocardiopsis exhalans]USY19452.1 ATP-grasp domain-containing protein [Nocardiopsis exhalans]
MDTSGIPVVLAMRDGLRIRDDHVDTLRRLGLAIHLLTEEQQARDDTRYTAVHLLPAATTDRELEERITAVLASTGAPFALTFQETDIVAVGRANSRYGVHWSRPDADAVARDKTLQRAHLTANGLPAPRYRAVGAHGAGPDALDHVGLPCVVKPTRGASSSHVELVRTPEEATAALDAIERLARSGAHHFYDVLPDEWALVEEYLPGEEVTCDGVVIDGRFHLGGVHTKVLPDSPWFEEDLYTLPYGDPAVEQEITATAQAMVSALDLEVALFNVELRRDSQGRFRVVEFSTRISGGHVYRNIRDVHEIDLVELFVRAALGEEGIAKRARDRHPGACATCIKFVYRNGIVVSNGAGRAEASSAFAAYYPLATPGQEVRSAPEGFDLCGLLSVRAPYEPRQHPAQVHRVAEELLGELDLVVAPFAARVDSTGRPDTAQPAEGGAARH